MKMNIKQRALIVAMALIFAALGFPITFFLFNLYFKLFGTGIISTILILITLFNLVRYEVGQISWVQRKFSELKMKESTPGKFPQELEEVLVANLNKNVMANLAEQEKLKKLSPVELKKRQKDYHEKTSKWVEAALEKKG